MREWFYEQPDGRIIGPYPDRMIRRCVELGVVRDETRVRIGNGAWVPASFVVGVFDKERSAEHIVQPLVPETAFVEVDGPAFVQSRNLIDCPDCGRSISKAAAVCPQCGRPRPHTVKQPQRSDAEELLRSLTILFAGGIAIFGFVVFVSDLLRSR